MKDIHAHEILKMMEGNSYSNASLKDAIKGLNADGIVDFLEKKGKFKSCESGFTMDISKVCETY